jgi:hypothetical protein
LSFKSRTVAGSLQKIWEGMGRFMKGYTLAMANSLVEDLFS